MKSIYNVIVCSLFLLLTACSDYLDVIPDNMPTIDHAFSDRNSAETYLFTCYSYMPVDQLSRGNNVSLMSGESWMVLSGDNYWERSYGFRCCSRITELKHTSTELLGWRQRWKKLIYCYT